ncbi:MAG: hypothetical protein WBN14_00080 [Polyangiales bacterium]
MKNIPRFTLSLVLAGLILSGTVVSAQDAQTRGSSAQPERGIVEAGEVIAIRHLTLKKKTDPGAFERYVAEEYAPAYQKFVPGVRALILKADRGKNAGKYIHLFIFDSLNTRDLYFPAGKPMSEIGVQVFKPVEEEYSKLQQYVTGAPGSSSDKFTDYVVLR